MVDDGTGIVKPAQAAKPLGVWPWIRGKSSNEERVPVWDTVKRRLLLGHSSPIGLNIDRYLASRPHMRLWTGNDPYEPKPPLLPGWRNRHEIYMARLDVGETPDEARERVDSVAAVTEETALDSAAAVIEETALDSAAAVTEQTALDSKAAVSREESSCRFGSA